MTMTANTENGRVIALELNRFDHHKKAWYFCPYCRSELVLKAGDVKIHHFAHKVKSDCIMNGESQKHLEGKAFIYNLNDTLAEFEKRVGNRIGDVVLGNTVIEIQNSNISVDEIKDRFKDWNESGYSMMWILTDNQIDVNNPITKIKGWHQELFNIYGCLYVYSNGGLYKIIKIQNEFCCNKLNHFEPINDKKSNYKIKKFKVSSLIELSDKINEINSFCNLKNKNKLYMLSRREYYKNLKSDIKHKNLNTNIIIYLRELDDRIENIDNRIYINEKNNNKIADQIYNLEVDRIEIENKILDWL